MWHPVSTAPFDRDLELAIIDTNGVHAIAVPCRRILGGWMVGNKTRITCVRRIGAIGLATPNVKLPGHGDFVCVAPPTRASDGTF